MSDETGAAEVAEAVETEEATDTTSTAEAENTEEQPESSGSDSGGDEAAENKTFSQEEVDKKIQKRLARQDRQSKREMARLEAQIESLMALQGVNGGSDIDSGELSVDELLEQATRRAEQNLEAREFEAKRDNILDAVSDINPDFEVDDFASLPISETVADAIMSSDMAPQLVNHLSENPNEAIRISKLSAGRQAAEIGKLESKMSSPAPKTTGAPKPPAKPVKATSSAKPRYYEGMSDEEYNRKRREDLANKRK